MPLSIRLLSALGVACLLYFLLAMGLYLLVTFPSGGTGKSVPVPIGVQLITFACQYVLALVVVSLPERGRIGGAIAAAVLSVLCPLVAINFLLNLDWP